VPNLLNAWQFCSTTQDTLGELLICPQAQVSMQEVDSLAALQVMFSDPDRIQCVYSMSTSNNICFEDVDSRALVIHKSVITGRSCFFRWLVHYDANSSAHGMTTTSETQLSPTSLRVLLKRPYQANHSNNKSHFRQDVLMHVLALLQACGLG